MPRAPRPASTITTTAPMRQQAYRQTVRSSPGGTSRATRSPFATPCATRPAATRRTSASSSANVMDAPDPVVRHLDHRDFGVGGAPVEPVPRRRACCRVSRRVSRCDATARSIRAPRPRRRRLPTRGGWRRRTGARRRAAGEPRGRAGRCRRTPDRRAPTGAARERRPTRRGRRRSCRSLRCSDARGRAGCPRRTRRCRRGARPTGRARDARRARAGEAGAATARPWSR